MSQSIVINNLEDLENIRNEIISFALEFDSIAQRKQYTFGQIENINVFHNTRYTDILAKDISKASELLKLFYQLKAEQLYTIGDGENDISMFQEFPCSYAMINGVDALKELAYRVTEYSNDEDGVAKTVEKLLKV